MKLLYSLPILFVSALLISGCSGDKKTKVQDSFFNRWKVKAEESKGFSPSSKKIKTLYSNQKNGSSYLEDKPTQKKSLPKDRINLIISDTDLPTVLRIMARSANLNILINEKIKGKISLNIKQASWDDVFLGILSTQGLTYTWKGEILCVLTEEDLKQNRNMEPLEIRVFQINYADPEVLKTNLLRFLKGNSSEQSSSSSSSMTLSPTGNGGGSSTSGATRGDILVDPHTNSLMIQAVKSDMERLVPLIHKLDRPAKQIRIEAHIIEANRNTAEELGVLWGGRSHSDGNVTWIGSGSTGATGSAIHADMGVGKTLEGKSHQGFYVNLINEKLGKSLLSVQLNALASDGKLNILSRPSITTMDNRKATIESGRDVPYQSGTSDSPSVSFKKAVISLEVTPHVIDSETLKLVIKTSKDEVDNSLTVGGPNGNPGIITKSAETEVVLLDGQTTVIGGLQKDKSAKSEMGVPFLKDIPILGWLFRYNSNKNDMEEMLIFITPHILEDYHGVEDVSTGVFGGGSGSGELDGIEFFKDDTTEPSKAKEEASITTETSKESITNKKNKDNSTSLNDLEEFETDSTVKGEDEIPLSDILDESLETEGVE